MQVMLAATLKDPRLLRFPVLASPKLDGIRATVRDGIVYSRNAKPIPNRHVQNTWGNKSYDGLDGELIVGDPTDPACYRNTSSGVMSADGEPDVQFFVFDIIADQVGFQARIDYLFKKRVARINLLRHKTIHTLEEMQRYEAECLEAGFEGIMLRDPHGVYKYGRSTMREQGLIKVKQFQDAEAEIIGYEEKMHNGNEAQLDELGRTKRTSHKANKTGKGTLGALVCKTPQGVEFNIGTGFSDVVASELWAVRDCLIGRSVTYKFFPTGSKEAPRFPVYKGLRQDL